MVLTITFFSLSDAKFYVDIIEMNYFATEFYSTFANLCIQRKVTQ